MDIPTPATGYTVQLEVIGGNAFPQPAEIRLRSALKVLLRAFGLRCAMISASPMPMPPQAPPPPEKRRKARSKKPTDSVACDSIKAMAVTPSEEAPCDSE